MKIKIIWLGATKMPPQQQLIELYKKRLSHYCRLDIVEIKGPTKKGSEEALKSAEAQSVLKSLQNADFVVCLDETGKLLSSIELSGLLQDRMNQSAVDVVFIIGGAFGLDQSLLDRSNLILSLSRMTFTHDMARVILLEQIYRGFTILRGEKYHNG